MTTKNKILFLILIHISLTTVGQVKIYNLSLTDSSKNIFYIGGDNKIKITGVNNQSNLKLTSSLNICDIIKSENNTFIVRAKSEHLDTIKVSINDSIVLIEKYECKRIPDPIPIFANTVDLNVSKVQIKSFPYLSSILPNCLYKFNFTVVGFESYFLFYNGDFLDSEKRNFKNERIGNYKLTFKENDEALTIGEVIQLKDSIYIYDSVGEKIGFLKEIKIKSKGSLGGYLNAGQLALIEKMQSDDMIIFRNIKVRSNDSCNRIIGSLVITIK